MSNDAAGSITKFEYNTVKVNDINVHYVTHGSRDNGPMMLCVHGFFNFSHYWRDQLIEFGKDHFVVAPDMRGANLSSRPEDVGQYKLDNLVEDLRQLNEKLNDGKKFILVGHDWGGLVSYVFSLHYPELVEKLIISNAPHPQMFERELNNNPWQQYLSNYMLLANGYILPGEVPLGNVIPKDRETLTKHFAKGWIADQVASGHYSEEDRQKWIDAWAQPGAFKAGEKWYDANNLNPPFNNTHPASGVASSWSTAAVTKNAKTLIWEMPTLILWGVDDDALPSGNLTGFDEFFTDIKIRLWAHEGHALTQENSAEVNAEIRAFLTGNESPKVCVYPPYLDRDRRKS